VANRFLLSLAGDVRLAYPVGAVQQQFHAITFGVRNNRLEEKN
jgi:hypothetical protein